MKIVSWNVNLNFENGDMLTRICKISEIIKKMDPDILLLQEASDYFLNYLNDIWKFNTASKSNSHGGMLCILISERHKNFVPIKYLGIYCGIIVDNLKIVNCHLVNGKSLYSVKDRNKFYEIISNENKENLIIGGDFNDNDNDIDEILKMNDVGKIYNTPTWFKSFFENGSKIKTRYDRFFTNINIKHFDTLTKYCGHSDHIPIAIDI